MKSGNQFPALREFLRGYFHQDCIEEYGALVGAAQQFVKDADVEQRESVAHEWEKFLKPLRKLSLGKINAALSEMGSACEFASLDEVRRVGVEIGPGPMRG